MKNHELDEIEEAAKLARQAELDELPYPYHPGFLRVNPEPLLVLVEKIRKSKKAIQEAMRKLEASMEENKRLAMTEATSDDVRKCFAEIRAALGGDP
jgi:polyhydroxyalkanoate synthesis regulator protein